MTGEESQARHRKSLEAKEQADENGFHQEQFAEYPFPWQTRFTAECAAKGQTVERTDGLANGFCRCLETAISLQNQRDQGE
jgi:hypothetical protein